MALPNFHRFSPTLGKWKVPVGQKLQYTANQGYHTIPDPNYVAPAPPPTLDQRVNTILNSQFKGAESLISQQAKQLQAEAAGRAQNYQDAYKAAGLANSQMGLQAQAGWDKAGSAIEGLSGILTGGVGTVTQADVDATNRQLANIGAPSTGYDATTQQGVENYYGGTLPGKNDRALGAIANQYAVTSGQALNTRGLQESLAAQQNTIHDINTSAMEQSAALAAKRPDTYASIRTLFSTEQDSALKAKLAKQELLDRRLSDAQTLKFKYAELAQNATTEADRRKWQADENAMDREIDKINAEANKTNAATSKYQAHHPTPSKDKYNTGTYQQKIAAVTQDELQNVESVFLLGSKPEGFDDKDTKTRARIPILSNVDGRPVIDPKTKKARTTFYTDKVWANNERLRYREHVFAKIWPMVEGNIAKGNRDKARRYLRSKIWKIALQWDPNTIDPKTGKSAVMPSGSTPGNPLDDTTIT